MTAVMLELRIPFCVSPTFRAISDLFTKFFRNKIRFPNFLFVSWKDMTKVLLSVHIVFGQIRTRNQSYINGDDYGLVNR